MPTHPILIGLSILVTLCSNSRVDAQTISSPAQGITEEHARICSIFGAVIANAEGIKQGDVLFLERNFYDGLTFNNPPDEGTLDEFRLVRVVFDEDQGLFLTLSRTISEWFVLGDLSAENDGRVIKASDTGSLSDRSSHVINSKQDNLVAKSTVKAPLPDYLLEPYDDPRTVGMFGCGLGPLSRALDMHRENLTGERLLDWKIEDDGFHLRNATPIESSPGRRWVESYVFDHNSNLPVRVETYGESIKTIGGRSIPHYGIYQWKAMSGLHVPLRLNASSFSGYKNPHERQVDAKLAVQIDFHWFSINEPIPDELFDEANLSDSKRFQDLIDPRTAKATTLIEIIEKLDPKYKLVPKDEPPAIK